MLLDSQPATVGRCMSHRRPAPEQPFPAAYAADVHLVRRPLRSAAISAASFVPRDVHHTIATLVRLSHVGATLDEWS